MRVSYFHDVAMPSRFAAPIQILNTARELAALGVPTTVYSGPLRGDVDSCLAFYGLTPHPNLTIRRSFRPCHGNSTCRGGCAARSRR